MDRGVTKQEESVNYKTSNRFQHVCNWLQQGTSLPHNQTVMPPGLIWFVYTMDDSLLILSHNLMKVEKFKSLEKKTIYD